MGETKRSLRRELRAGVVVLADLVGLSLAGLVAWAAWAYPVRNQPLGLYLQLWPLPLFFVGGYAQAGLYPGTGLGPVETMRRLTYVTSITFLVVAAISFGLQLPYVYSRVTYALAFAGAVVFVPVMRLALLAVVSRVAWWPERVVLATDDVIRARRTIQELAWNRNLGYLPVATLWLGSREPDPAAGLPPVVGADGASELSRATELVLLAASGSTNAAQFDALHRQFRRVLVIRELDELPVEGIRIRNLGNLLGIEYTNNLLDGRNQVVKRALDLTVGSFAFLVSLPLVLLAIAAVKLASPAGPAFFVQQRTGSGGRRIGVPKIRTMVPGAEQKLEEAMAADAEVRREWEATMKLRNDPRLIPGVGRFLRRWSLDELPQLWSVVTGDMSLVGPRPFPDYHLEQFSERFRELRARVRPGITGLWQVNVRSSGPLEQQQSLDTYYIRNWSLWLDLYILARTVRAVCSGRGAF